MLNIIYKVYISLQTIIRKSFSLILYNPGIQSLIELVKYSDSICIKRNGAAIQGNRITKSSLQRKVVGYFPFSTIRIEDES